MTGWLLSPSRADAPIVPDPDAWMYVGKNVTVEGVVTAVSTSKKGNTFINFGGVYPNQTFTGWVPASTDLAWDNLESLKGMTGLYPKLINSETTASFFAHGKKTTYSNLVLKGVMIYDTKTGHFDGSQGYVSVDTPNTGGVARFGDYMAMWIGTGRSSF